MGDEVMTGFEKAYGRDSLTELIELMKAVKPAVNRTYKLHKDELEIEWADGAYVLMRCMPNTVHFQEIVNASNGVVPEGLYRALYARLPHFFEAKGCDTMTCEPSDAEARLRLATGSTRWEVWEHHTMHDVWVWWLQPRSINAIDRALWFAYTIQNERKELQTNDR